MTTNVEFVSAGAGSGKTYTLTQKLNELLESGEIQPRGVIATTFTRLAAGELRERVRTSLMESGNIAMANLMGQAAINTVNGVCGELLKRFSFEAGSSPEQLVIEEDEANRLFGQAVGASLDNDGERIRHINDLAYRLGYFDKKKPVWRIEVKRIADAARANNVSPESLIQFASESSDALLSHFRAPIKRDLDRELSDAIVTAMGAVDTSIDTTKKTRDYLRFIDGALRDLHQGRLTWSDWAKLSKSAPGAKSKVAAEAIAITASDFESHPKLHSDIREFTKELCSLAGESLNAYQATKRRQGLVDFVDQELQVYDLLEHPEVKSALAGELQLLMVDEFQDTSPIQLALFVRLAKLAKRVIWVGDIKQAIYGFRGSDPSLMEAVLGTILADGGETQVLKKSWRSRPALVKYCNDIFSHAFADSLPKEKVVLAPARDEILENAAVIHWPLAGNLGVKMASIASGIRDLVETGYKVVDKQSGDPRPVRYGDIAVLCRSGDRLQQLAQACSESGLSVGYKRYGLLSTPEGALAMACIRKLADKRDTLAAAEIRTLATGESVEVWLPGRVAHVGSEIANAEWAEKGTDLVSAVSTLAEARPTLSVLTPVEAMQVALSAADIRGVVNRWGPTTAKSRARLANLDCMVALAAEYEGLCEVRNAAATVSGLILWLSELAESKEDWQAVGADDETVNLVTHHGAKGLEWPVVIAVDLEKEVRTRLWGLTVIPRKADFDVQDPLAGRSLRFWPYPFGKQSSGIVVKDRIEESDVGVEAAAKSVEEEKRLLYVSFTRPRDLLILPLASTPHKSIDTLDSSWMVPTAESLKLPESGTIPTESRTFEPSGPVEADASKYLPNWLGTPVAAIDVIARRFSPSSAAPIETASIGRTIELGERLPLNQVEDMSRLGSAIHGVIAASVVAVEPLSTARTVELLKHFGVNQSVSAENALQAANRLIQFINQQYTVLELGAECPITAINELGQEMTGFIDLIVETPEGWIIIDHKSSPASRREWESIALQYSGQLAAYSNALTRVSGKPVLECWVHFAVTGGLVQVVL